MTLVNIALQPDQPSCLSLAYCTTILTLSIAVFHAKHSDTISVLAEVSEETSGGSFTISTKVDDSQQQEGPALAEPRRLTGAVSILQRWASALFVDAATSEAAAAAIPEAKPGQQSSKVCASAAAVGTVQSDIDWKVAFGHRCGHCAV